MWYSPRRLIHHPSNFKYELRRYIIVAKLVDGKEIELKTSKAVFGEEPMQVTVTLPPQIEVTSGELRIGAEYGDGLVVYSEPGMLVKEWPHYGETLS